MTRLKLTTALAATLAFAVPAYAQTANVPAKSEALGTAGGEVTTEAGINAEASVEGNAKYEAVTPQSELDDANVKVQDNARYDAVTGEGSATAEGGATVTAGTTQEMDNTNERYDAVTPDKKLQDTDAEVEDNARFDAVTPEATLSGLAGVQADNARYDAVTPDEKTGFSTDGSVLAGAHVYVAEGDMLGQIEGTGLTGATVAFHDAESFAVPKATFKWEDLDFFRDKSSGEIAAFVRADDADIRAALAAQVN